MDTSGSVSKGCFAFKGKKKTAKVEDYLRPDKSGGAKKRHAGFIEMWNELDIQIQILQSNLNSKIFDDLLKFATTSQAKFKLEADSVASREIPTAALVTGVNTPDHSVMFGNLLSMLREHVTPLVAIMRSKDCSNVKHMLSKTLGQMLDGTHQSILDDEEDEGQPDVKLKNLPLTLSTLAKWYKNKYQTGASSPKKRKSTNGKAVPEKLPPLVIVFEDFERFLPKVVQDFVTIASNYISQLPLVFVFGIATSVSAVHRLLPNEVSSLLCMEKFQAPPSSEYLSLVINEILMTPKFPFKLGSKVFQLLLDIFLYHDFSVLNFNKGLRFSLLDHCFTQPLSYLCCSLDNVKSTVKTMNKESIELLRQIPSFMRYVESCPTSEQPDLLLEDSFTKERATELLTAIFTYHETFYPMLKCLHTLVGKLPSYPLGKQVREVYSMSLESNIFETESYTKALELLRLMSKDELEELVSRSVQVVTDVPDQLTEVKEGIQSLLERFSKLSDQVNEPEEEEDEAQTNLPTKTSLHQLRQQLQDISKRKKKLSPYEKLRLEIVDYFDTQFRKYLMCPKSLPLHEIFYYDSASTVKRHLNAAPRSAVQMALSNPNHYLQCKCCKSEGSHVTASMPDICIVYKLHLECAQMINLYDWMQAFITVVEPEEEENTESSGQPNKQLQARFIQAVSELQFLGFIKPTKRKTDHVARLTWGGC